MSRDLVSVVTVSFNEGDSLLKTVRSVVSQTYRPFEYIIIDGGSTDGSFQRTMNEMTPMAAHAGIELKAVSEPDGVIYFGMNKGTAMASGKWVNFMNAGDWFYDDDTIDRVFRQDIPDGCALIYGDFIREKDYASLQCVANEPERIAFEMPTSHQAMFILTEMMKKYQYDTSFRVVADFDFVHRLYVNGATFSHFSCVDSTRCFLKNFSHL